MTKVFITIDTELSALLHQRGVSPRENFESSMLGRTSRGDFGIGWQMARLSERGLKAVYFVDPMPALVYGIGPIRDAVAMIQDQGHEVQLHIHTEWLEWAKDSPFAGRTGRNIADFGLEDQNALLALASNLLVEAGTPAPTAFRAGNFGANDETLRALAQIGIAWDSSYNAAWAGNPCQITLNPAQAGAVRHCGIAEIPISGIEDRPGRFRPAQICALSAGEMRAALNHAANQADALFMIVTHSFEMLSRDRNRPNRLVMRRFEAMCDAIAANPALHSSGFAELEDTFASDGGERNPRLGPSALRTYWRMAEQAIGTWAYERQLRPL